MRYRIQGRQHAQALVEFAVVSPFLLLILFGFLDLGLGEASSLSLNGAVRAGARFAAVSPLAYDPTNPASAGTIQGAVQESALLDTIASSQIAIAYFLPEPSGVVECGTYSTGTDSFVAQPGFTEGNCLVQGVTVVQVSAAIVYDPITPLFKTIDPSGMTLTASSSLTLEQTS